LSHTIFVIGFGSSCSHPLFAKRPSSTDGSFVNEISRSPPAPAEAPGSGGTAAAARLTARVRGTNAVSGTTPS
jgi:hypothetical protein